MALDTAEGALGLPVTPRGDRCGWAGAPWSWLQRRGLEGLLEGPEGGEVGMGDGDGVVVRWTIWWVYWGMRGGTGDDVMGLVEGTWRR